MASRQFLHLIFLLSLLLSSPYLSLSQISIPPSLPPTSSTSSADSLASPPEPSDSIPPSSSPLASPPAFSPSSDDLPDEAPAPSPVSPSVPGSVSVPVPVPAPSNAEMKASSIETEEHDETEKKGLNGGGKAGVVIGVFAATALVGLGVLVCKKRQENIRRSRYGYSSRVEMI